MLLSGSKTIPPKVGAKIIALESPLQRTGWICPKPKVTAQGIK